MDVIMAYLDTMFSAYPQTPRLLEAKRELRAMMEDAYSDLIDAGHSHNEAVGRVITDFGNLDELAPTLGISSEIGQNALGEAETVASDPVPVVTSSPKPPLTLEEAQGYADARRRAQPKLAIAVALFVLAPAAMFLVIGLTNLSSATLVENSNGALGLIPLLVLIAVGVLLVLSRERDLSQF